MRVRLSLALLAASFGFAPAALANSSQSSNWAGYAVHRSGVHFHNATGTWTQPSLTCTAGHSSYSAFWVGIGGYSATSEALEQIGTEADCHLSGRQKMTAWYELVPAPSKSLKLTIHAGDTITASVIVTGHQVTMTLKDATTHKSVTKSLHASLIDTSSAEWITEAPSECTGSNSCQTLPLADFGSTTFDFAGVQTTSGTRGTISNKAYNTTRITLVPGGPRFVGNSPQGIAKPTSLFDSGGSFTVNYSTSVNPSLPAASADVLPGAVISGGG
jgi:Peptidase A4 family